MKKINTIILAGMLLLGASCKKELDINNNPNNATYATPALVLPQALTATANNLNGFNTMGAELVGYAANAGGYGGFGTAISYNFSSSDFIGRWSSTYDNLEDYQYIINSSKGNAQLSYYLGVARVMKALSFQLLVDNYNDVPYSQALLGAANLTPKYDDAKTIYKSLADELDSAMNNLKTGDVTPSVTPLGSSDVMFGGNVTKWKQFINTLKLRILVRGNGFVTFSNKTFSTDGFLAEDALINPGFKRDNGRQNPKWNTWGFGSTGSDATKSWIPNKYVFAFYDGTKLSDPGRGAATYYKFPATGLNRLGVENTTIPNCPPGSFWYPSTSRTGATAGATTGPLKGPSAGYPVITAAEAYFLRAEAGLVGITTENPTTMFNSGIDASFRYVYTAEDGIAPTTSSAATTTYLAANTASYLANLAVATTTAQKLEAIITQKYIALNFVNSEEAWNEYRRTGYPKVVPGGPDYATFASTVSESTRPDKLPTRILYPSSEGAYNSSNMPKGISPFTSLIFWAK
jgi:hypothetical protein